VAQRNIRAMSADELFASWKQWIEHDIYEELIALASSRHTYKAFRNVFRQNAGLTRAGWFFDWVTLNYIARAGMTLRRQMDDQAGNVNLRQFLQELQDRPEVMTRRRYVDAWNPPDADRWLADRSFTKNFELVKPDQDKHNDHVDPKMVRRDRELLIQATGTVTSWVNRTIAHRGQVPPMAVPTFGDLHGCVDALESTFKKYYNLITQSSLVQLEPFVQFDKYDIFTQPWISDPRAFVSSPDAPVLPKSP
jgi:hypothetical protein